ncbi:hypothetical protein EUA79_02090 [TM7 phylum sp. oral taxon 351]|nr:hypothetical protein EUA79_02090 [TM7 phylum sp. oral taxon 351]
MSGERLSNSDNQNKNTSAFDDFAERVRREQEFVERRREDTRHWARYYVGAEQAFDRRVKANKISETEFMKWEDEVGGAFFKMKEAEYDACYASKYEKDREERISMSDRTVTAEVYAGNFYEERTEILKQKILENPNPKERDAQLKILGDLPDKVCSHIEAERDFDLKKIDGRAYLSARKDVHNSLIRNLNKINKLADNYGVRRLTFRNFLTNDDRYDEYKDIYLDTDGRYEYDRSSVEKYMRIAFADLYDQAENDGTLRVAPNKQSKTAYFHSLGED